MFYKKCITGEVSGVTPTNNVIKDVVKAIKFLKNTEILLKETNEENYQSKMKISQFSQTINLSWFTINENVRTPLASSVQVTLGLTAAATATDVAIQKKSFGQGTTELIISNKEMDNIMKAVQSFDESCLLIKDVSQIIKNESKELKDGFLEMLLDTLAASILRNMFVVKPKRPG